MNAPKTCSRFGFHFWKLALVMVSLLGIICLARERTNTVPGVQELTKEEILLGRQLKSSQEIVAGKLKEKQLLKKAAGGRMTPEWQRTINEAAELAYPVKDRIQDLRTQQAVAEKQKLALDAEIEVYKRLLALDPLK